MSGFNIFKKMNKKGNVFDVIVFMSSILGAVIMMLFAFYMFTQIKDEFQKNDITNTTEINNAMSGMETGFFTLDKLFFPFMITAMIVGLIITNLFVPTHPIFILIDIIGIIFLVFMGITFNLVYETLYSNAELNAFATQLPYIYYGMQMLPWFGAVAIFVSAIIGYSKSSGGQSGI